jgi:hypothetical protein
MPSGMGKMMRVMGKGPGAMAMIKPKFPLLYSKLLPIMMPKVMDTMLSRVGEMISMPDYIAKQMPELMDNLMSLHFSTVSSCASLLPMTTADYGQHDMHLKH